MSDLKTKQNDQDVKTYLKSIEDEKKRADSLAVLELMKEVTGEEPRMWGDSIVGFGHYHYKYESGREGDWFLTGFASRARNITLYIGGGFDSYDALLKDLGKFKTGKSCLYINKIEDIDQPTLRELVKQSVAHMSHPSDS